MNRIISQVVLFHLLNSANPSVERPSTMSCVIGVIEILVSKMPLLNFDIF